MVVVDSLSKVVHFIGVNSTNLASEVALIFIREIMIFHGVPDKIILEKDAKFTSMFWEELFGGFAIELAFSKAYHL